MRTSSVIAVGFTTKHRDNITDLLPRFEPNKGTKDAAKQVEQVRDKTDRFLESCTDKPWMGELQDVALFSTTFGAERLRGKDDIIHELVGLVDAHHGGDFNKDGSWKISPIRFVGFNIRQFVKLFGLGAAEENCWLPHEIWYGSDHRDIGSAVLPSTECSDVPLSAALSALQVKTVPHGYIPGDDALKDLKLVVELTTKLNLFPQFRKEFSKLLQPRVVKKKKRKAQPA